MTLLQRCFPQLFAGVAILLLVIALSAGFWITGGPDYQHKLRVDEKQVNYISSLRYRIEAYVRTNKELPPSLQVLNSKRILNQYSKRDDQYAPPGLSYERQGKSRYTLCARFAVDTRKSALQRSSGYGGLDTVYLHPLGRHCFSWRRIPTTHAGMVDFQPDN